MTNMEKFKKIYTEKLTEAHAKHPEEYFYPTSAIPGVVEKMCAAFATGGANIEGAAKATAKALGIKPTMGGIKAYLAGA